MSGLANTGMAWPPISAGGGTTEIAVSDTEPANTSVLLWVNPSGTGTGGSGGGSAVSDDASSVIANRMFG